MITKFRFNYVVGSIMLLGAIGAINSSVLLGKLNQSSQTTCRAAIQADVQSTLERFSREQAALEYYNQQEAKVTAAMALPITAETNVTFNETVAQARKAGDAFRHIGEAPRTLLADTVCPPLWLN